MGSYLQAIRDKQSRDSIVGCIIQPVGRGLDKTTPYTSHGLLKCTLGFFQSVSDDLPSIFTVLRHI